MAFTVRVTFVGLGVAVIHSKRQDPDVVEKVDLLLVDATKATSHVDDEGNVHKSTVHLPRMTFKLDDLIEPVGPFPGPHVTTGSVPLIELELDQPQSAADRDIRLTSPGGSDRHGLKLPMRRSALQPGFLASETAVSWIPDAKEHLGISDLVVPGESLEGTPYIARVRLGSGVVSSNYLFRKEGGGPVLVTFGSSTEEHALAEQIVWTRRGVESLEFVNGRRFKMDALVRRLQDEDPVVEISVTNLPKTFVSGRFQFPTHFKMYRAASASKAMTNPVKPGVGLPPTAGPSCPPLRLQVFS